MMFSLCLFIYLHNWFAAYIAGQLCITKRIFWFVV